MSEIEPALTAEEWREIAELEVDQPGALADELGYYNGHVRPLAVIAILSQHAGRNAGPLFTWKMVEALSELLDDHVGDFQPFPQEQIDAAHRAVTTLAALLPPREP